MSTRPTNTRMPRVMIPRTQAKVPPPAKVKVSKATPAKRFGQIKVRPVKGYNKKPEAASGVPVARPLSPITPKQLSLSPLLPPPPLLEPTKETTPPPPPSPPSSSSEPTKETTPSPPSSSSSSLEPTKKLTPSLPSPAVEVIEGKKLSLHTAKLDPILSSNTKPAIVKAPPNKGIKLSLNETLAEARRWLVKPNSYMIRNPDTGCWGLSSRKPRLSEEQWQQRATITIAHARKCDCHDVRLKHICEHVDRLVKKGLVARRFRNDLVIVIKTRRRLPQMQMPSEVRLPRYRRQRMIERPEEEVKGEDRVRRVVEIHENQVLIENWKNLEVFRKRRIWQDW